MTQCLAFFQSGFRVLHPAHRHSIGRPHILAAFMLLLTGSGCLQSTNGNAPGDNLETRPRTSAELGVQDDSRSVVAGRGETMESLAERAGLNVDEFARINGLYTSYQPLEGEIFVTGRRQESPSSEESIADIAQSAIDRTESNASRARRIMLGDTVTHVVEPGETIYSIARLYNVDVIDLATVNGLDSSLSIEVRQVLLVPVDAAVASDPDTASTPAPPPPSAIRPLPKQTASVELPKSPNLGNSQTPAGAGRKLAMPLQGEILREYSGKAGGNEGIDIQAAAGTPVAAAEDGEIALVTSSKNQNSIILIRHRDNLLTVYSRVTRTRFSQGQAVERGQTIAEVAEGNPSFLHFEVRRGTRSVDPAPYIN